ncbi:hypothetical protein [Lysobacter humi (ex Lee et al. 2017)]
MTARPVVFVLAGVNGAGKSSVGGLHLESLGVDRDDWYNPDEATRTYIAAGLSPDEANSRAWHEGRERLEIALDRRRSHAFETTLGGRTIPALLARAADTHDVMMWFCGLDSLERHLARVAARVARGGHHIDEAKIRARWESSLRNLIDLLPHLAVLGVYDNSEEAGADGVVPTPRRVLQVEDGHVLYPTTPRELADTPRWAMPVVERALQLEGR